MRGGQVAVTIVAVAACASCRAPAGFQCQHDEQCEAGQRADGICFATVGACGYPASACASGYRYSDFAPAPWSGTCVPLEDDESTSGGDEQAPSTSTTGASSSGDSIPQTSSTTADPIPGCGNGEVEGDELCDDGNAQEADGCNPDCRPSGHEIGRFSSQVEGEDQGFAIVALDESDVVVGGLLGESGMNREGTITRYAINGVVYWTTQITGSANRDDQVDDLVMSATGDVLAVGKVIPTAPKKVTPRSDVWLGRVNVDDGSLTWEFTDPIAPPSNDYGTGIVELPRGDVVLSMRVGPNGNQDFAVGRYAITQTGDGFVLNPSWNHAFDGGDDESDHARAVAFDPAGRLIVGGHLTPNNGSIDRHLRALDLDGEPLDPPCVDMGGDDPLDADDRIIDVAVGPSGEVAAVGWAVRENEEEEDAWVGYYAPGSCTLSWARTVPGIGQSHDSFEAVEIDTLGNVVVGGYLNVGNGNDAALSKYSPSGLVLWSIDPIDGPGNGDDRIYDLAIAPNGEIVVTGRLSRPDEVDVWVARFTP